MSLENGLAFPSEIAHMHAHTRAHTEIPSLVVCAGDLGRNGAELFITALNWKESTCLLLEWKSSMWPAQTVEFYTAVNIDEGTLNESLRHNIEWKPPGKES